MFSITERRVILWSMKTNGIQFENRIQIQNLTLIYVVNLRWNIT